MTYPPEINHMKPPPKKMSFLVPDNFRFLREKLSFFQSILTSEVTFVPFRNLPDHWVHSMLEIFNREIIAPKMVLSFSGFFPCVLSDPKGILCFKNVSWFLKAILIDETTHKWTSTTPTRFGESGGVWRLGSSSRRRRRSFRPISAISSLAFSRTCVNAIKRENTLHFSDVPVENFPFVCE